MPELPTESVVARFRRMTLTMACLLPLCAIAAVASAQVVPPGLRACAAETDPGQRLDCYDREMKRLMATAAPRAMPAQPGPATPATPAAPAAPAVAPGTPTAPVAVTSTPASSEAAAVPAVRASHHAHMWKLFSGGGASRVTARIVRVDRAPGSMVLHLDNGQVWRQTGRASGELGLAKGDEVTISEHLGSYWLSSSHVADMRVQQVSR